MKLTKFFKLKKAISNLDFNYVANKIAELEESLAKNGRKLEPENTAFTQEGIFYIQPESGMTSRVVLYESDYAMKLQSPPKQNLYVEGYDDPKVINRLHNYHLVSCNQITEAEKNGWGPGYRLAQRQTASFYYRIMKNTSKDASAKDIYQEIENQKLLICQNCFMKINSLLEGVENLKRETFELKYFFDVDFFASWCRYGEYVQDEGTMVKMYPKDWLEISRIRKAQVEYHCEGCEEDFSNIKLQRFLYVHPTDHIKQKVAYVKLQCLCMGCLSEQPKREYIKELPEYEDFLQNMNRRSDSAAVHDKKEAGKNSGVSIG